MKLNKTLAIALHRAMWTDMQTELGNNPTSSQRTDFKAAWINTYFPKEYVMHNCFLCEYAFKGDTHSCCACPIRWPGGYCAGPSFSYCTAPISDILALPEKGKKLTDLEPEYVAHDEPEYVAHDETELVRSYYKYREDLLSKASGIPGHLAIKDHIKAIQEKAVQQSTFSKLYCDTKLELAKSSGLQTAATITDHIKAIQEKAIEKYLEEHIVECSIDIDEAFKQYGNELKAPIFRTLAEASGLSSSNESVKAHIYRIRSEATYSGRKEKAEEIFKAMSVYSGVAEGNWNVYDHAMAIMKKASKEKELDETRRKLNDAVGALCLYQSTLSYESDLPKNAPVAAHIAKIREFAFSDGQDHERERIMDKIGELLDNKS